MRVVWADPKPNYRSFAQHTDGTPVKVDANRVNWKLSVNFLEA